ncbi:MAG TPA: hypothetical protein DD670_03440 [Planctomycetaceae bacterium]|nr:hypothetical protein [Planctomycetaceae bacterium]
MTHLHVLLEFDRKTNDLIKQQWRDAQARERIIQAGTALGGVLSVLLVAFGLLRFDLATAGAYRKHMTIGAILLLLALVVGWAGFVARFDVRSSDGMAEQSTRSVSVDWQATHASDGAHAADSDHVGPPTSQYSSESANSERAAAVAAGPVTIHSSRMRVFNAVIFLPLGCLAILLVAFRKTRLFGVGLLLLAALAMGTLVMVA